MEQSGLYPPLLVNAVGYVCWPHCVAAIYSAKSEASIRRNATRLRNIYSMEEIKADR